MKLATLFLMLALGPSAALAFGGEPANPQEPAAQPDPRKDPSRCYQNYCIGDSVRIGSTMATLEAYYRERGSFAIRYSDGSRSSNQYEPGQMALMLDGVCAYDNCVGDKVMIGSHIAYIEGLYPSGEAAVKYSDGSRSSKSFAASELARTAIGICHNNVCVGDEGSIGSYRMTVVGMYPSGKFAIRYSDGSYSSSAHDSSALAISKTSAQAESERRRQQEWAIAKGHADAGQLDMNVYAGLRNQGLSHEEALDKAMGPVWISPVQAEKFLQRLAAHVYQFDKFYLLEVSKLLAAGPNLERRQAFVGAAMLPYLRNFGYRSLKERYIDGSVKTIEAQLKQAGINSLQDIESTSLTRRLAVYMLAASLQTSLPQLNADQKERASRLLRILADSAGKSMKFREMEALMRALPEYKALLLEMTHNLYLQPRVTVDMQLLDYLENS